MKTEKLKPLSKLLSDFTYKNGYEISRVFDDFLQYIIWLHTMPEFGKPIDGWQYKPEEGKQFFEMYQALVLELQENLRHNEWFDIFGNIYEELIAGKSRRSNCGQFFTPPCLCDLMVEISNPKDEVVVGKNISDCACGSGRNLLAFHVKHLGNYMVGEDIDRTCAMMTVCNFILHGVKGEVIWHNTLIPDSYYGGWRVNENLNNPFRKYPMVLHAESNAIAKLAKSGNSSKGATIYITDEPCIDCAKLIIQAGIKRVVFAREYRKHDGIELLNQANIIVKQISESQWQLKIKQNASKRQ